MHNKLKYILIFCFSYIGIIYACTNCYIPIAYAGEDQLWAENVTVTLDGSISYDPEGENLTYLWTAPEGISLNDNTSVSPTFSSVDLIGSYVFSLIVNDGSKLTNDNTSSTTVDSSKEYSASPFSNLYAQTE